MIRLKLSDAVHRQYYLIMGWSVVFVAKDFTALGQPCLTLVALGGICYSVGAVFYAVKKPKHLCRVDLPRTVPPVDSGGVFLPLSGGISVCAVTQ